MPEARVPNVVIIGAGFGGLKCAQGLVDAPVQVALFDRHNYHLFQPLLYQVATAALPPSDIAYPIRRVFRSTPNVHVVMANVERVDLRRKVIHAEGGETDYDYLVVATGSTHSYFGHEEWSKDAPGLKTVDDAVEIRRRLLMAFEEAEGELDAASRRAKLTFVCVGGGPTGVELAGAIREIAARDIPRDFRVIDTGATRVLLVEANDRVIKQFPPELSERAKRDLENMGVEVRLNSRVTAVDDRGINIGDERIEAQNVFWTAGVKASPLGRTLGVELDRNGCVKVLPDLSVPGHPEVFVIGDLAHVMDPKMGVKVPGLAPAAMQMGKHVAHLIADEVTLGTGAVGRPEDRPPFRYFDKGNMATIGKNRAVAEVRGFKFGGLAAWLAWGVVHVMFLVSFRSKVFVTLSWMVSYFLNNRSVRLITGPLRPVVRKFRDVTPETLAGGDGRPALARLGADDRRRMTWSDPACDAAGSDEGDGDDATATATATTATTAAVKTARA